MAGLRAVRRDPRGRGLRRVRLLGAEPAHARARRHAPRRAAPRACPAAPRWPTSRRPTSSARRCGSTRASAVRRRPGVGAPRRRRRGLGGRARPRARRRRGAALHRAGTRIARDPARYLGDPLAFPGYGADAAALLVERGVAGLGIDTLGIDAGPRAGVTRPPHLAAGRPLAPRGPRRARRRCPRRAPRSSSARSACRARRARRRACSRSCPSACARAPRCRPPFGQRAGRSRPEVRLGSAARSAPLVEAQRVVVVAHHGDGEVGDAERGEPPVELVHQRACRTPAPRADGATESECSSA